MLDILCFFNKLSFEKLKALCVFWIFFLPYDVLLMIKPPIPLKHF